MPFTLPAAQAVVVDPELTAALNAFAAATPNLGIWRRWPDVTETEDELADNWACETVSAQLAAFLTHHGLTAHVVYADDAEHPWHADHRWVRVTRPTGQIDVDFTARQFHNLDSPAADRHQDVPCPLIWRAADTHPVSGRYRTVTG